MSYVFDSSSLIYLGKVLILEKISSLREENIIPFGVYEEVVTRGIARGDSEALRIKQLVEQKKFLVMTMKNLLPIFYDIVLLSETDKEVLTIAKEKKAVAIIDELYARAVATRFGIERHGSLYLILQLVQKKVISKKEAVRSIDKMITSGFYLSASKYREILEKIEKL